MTHPLLESGIAVTSVENCLPDMWKVHTYMKNL